MYSLDFYNLLLSAASTSSAAPKKCIHSFTYASLIVRDEKKLEMHCKVGPNSSVTLRPNARVARRRLTYE